MARSTRSSSLLRAAAALSAGIALALTSSWAANADTVIDGPVNLRSASSYGVLGASTVTNTGPTVVNGDVGLSPGTSVTGFTEGPGVIVGGVLHTNDEPAALAQADLTNAYNVAASLTPIESGIEQLNGRSLTPGVYSGDAVDLADTGAIAFAGSAASVWVIQAASSLTIGSGTVMTFSGGASACNVFWQVGSSATIGSSAQFFGTVLAEESITATTSATITGRLLARTGAVTLDTNLITVPAACPTIGTPSETVSPTITSGTPDDATVGTPYEFTVTAEGTPVPSYTVTDGALPAGLTLDTDTGVISGTPTTPGTSTFTITASNGDTPAATGTYTVTTTPAAVVPGPVLPEAPGGPAVPNTPGTPNLSGTQNAPSELANTGSDAVPLAAVGGAGLLAGLALLLVTAARRRTRTS